MKKDKVVRVTEKEKELLDLLRDRKNKDCFERMLIFTIMESEETMKLFEDWKEFVLFKEAEEYKKMAEVLKGLIS